MRTLRSAAERGHSQVGWLDSWHSFSFADYHDDAWMGFRALRVINDDVIAPGQGFGTHPHRDMEIITWVLDGSLEHRDSTGGGGIVRHGEAQGMSAGSGIWHSEFNPDKGVPLHLLQVWIQPDRRGGKPSYGQAGIPAADRRNRWATIAAGPDRPSALPIAADAAMLVTELDAGAQLAHRIPAGRHAWLHVARGAVTVDGRELVSGDALAVSGEPGLAITATAASELLLFDLA